MNTSILTRKRVLVPAVAVLALGIGGTAWAATASADDVRGTERDRVAAAAVAAAGGGDVTSVETSDDLGESYDVELRRADGTEIDLTLDSGLGVVERDSDGPDGPDGIADRDDDRDDLTDTPDADDRVLSADERAQAEQAALAAVGGGTVTGVEASDDLGVAYDVEVVKTDGTDWDVDLDDAFGVVGQRQDR